MILNALNQTFPFETIIRTADRDVANNTFADDGVIQFSVLANEVYLVEALLLYSSPVGGGTPNFKYAFVSSTGTLDGWLEHLYWSSGSGVPATSMVAVGNTVVGATLTTKRGIWIRGMMSNSANATFKLQWAQNTNNANPTRLHAGAFIRYFKMSA